MIAAQSFDIIRLESGVPFLFRNMLPTFEGSVRRMIGVRVADEIIGNVISEVTDPSTRSESDLVGRALIPSILFHHMGPGMKSFMRYLGNMRYLDGESGHIAMVGVPESIPIATLVHHLPFTCTVDVSHLIMCNPPLFERLKPHLFNGSFELTEELYLELRLCF